MPRRIWLDYLPYAAIDVILMIAVISEILNKRFDLLLANLPLLVLGLWSFSRKIRIYDYDPPD